MKGKDKIRFLATGDFHSDRKLVSVIKKYGGIGDLDFIVFTGDLSERDDDFSELLGMFAGKPIFMVPGNHESKMDLDKLKEFYGVHLVGNSPVIVNEDLVLFGSNYLNIGPYGIPEEKVFENLVENFNAVKDIRCKIHLSHIPPKDTQIGDASPFHPFIGGSSAIRNFIDNFKPDMTLVGHIHESSGLEEIVNGTKVVNVGRTFKLFEFDMKKKELNVLS